MPHLQAREFTLPVAAGHIAGTLSWPSAGKSIVLFAHGSGSSRHSPRNRFVAERLEEAGFGTLLMDLLTVEEDENYANRFDIPLLAARLLQSAKWLKEQSVETSIAFFGASTGAAAALIAAAEMGPSAKAVVSRGGRPDLAEAALSQVESPTLLIVGGMDANVLELNKQALIRLPASTIKKLEVVPGATHLFEEQGALETVSQLAVEWFLQYASA